MITLREFKDGLKPYLANPYARPFVCTGSPLDCRSFIVGLNAATRLCTFCSYWLDEKGFNREKFEVDYDRVRQRMGKQKSKGNRPVIKAIGEKIGPCLETNLYATPTRQATELTAADRKAPIIEYLFRAIQPKLVFVHSNEPIRFFVEATGCDGFTSEVKRARWQGHEFLLYGRPGPLYTLGTKKGAILGAELAKHLV